MTKRFIRFTALAILLALACITVPSWASGSVYLVLLPRKYFSNCRWDTEHARLGGSEVDNYIIGHGSDTDATMAYEIKGKYDMFESLVGYRDNTPEGRSCTFEVWADGVRVAKVGPLSSGSCDIIRAPIKGAKVILLRMVPSAYNATAGAMWGNPKLYFDLKDNEMPSSIIVNVDGRTYQTLPNKINDQREVNIPFPLKPGVNEYRVTTKFDETTNKLEVKKVCSEEETAVPEEPTPGTLRIVPAGRR